MLSPGASLGRYVVKRKLAEGGMAEVYLAQAMGPEGFAKDVVIKVVRSFLASEQQFIDMFIAEARLSSRLNHANIVQIFDFGKIDDSYYLAMEYVRGASLWDVQRRCKQHGIPFPPTIAAEIGANIARGLQYAHGVNERGKPLGIVHRDVTPHNVLISFEGAVKLTDFGIAKASTSQTAPGMLKGKFAYMSPEQARGESVDARTDIFALGVVLWELLTGGRLFEADSDVGVLRAVQELSIAPPSRLNGDVAPALSDIVVKALARPANERYQTAFELERALTGYVLANARAVEDSSPALFVQQLFREEYEVAEAANSAANPVPLQLPEDDVATADTLTSDGHATEVVTQAKATPNARGVMDDTTADRPKTAHMPGVTPSQRLKVASGGTRPSAKFEVGSTEPMPAAAPKPPSRVPPVARRDVEPTTPDSMSSPSMVAPASRWPIALAIAGVVTLGATTAAWQLTRSTPGAVPPLAGDQPRVEVVAPSSPALNPAEAAAPLPPVAAETFVAPGAGAPPPAPPVVAPPSPTEAAATPRAPTAAMAAPPLAAPSPPDVLTVKRVATPATGTLEVRAVPFATLFIDGKRVTEVEGSQRLKLSVGAHELVFKHPRSTQKMNVVLKPGQVVPVSFDALAE
ncbi:MAG: serine/threonine protein kinase [Archangium sp.]|nr:serine/threonine protein kinase [Archangium sp.]